MDPAFLKEQQLAGGAGVNGVGDGGGYGHSQSMNQGGGAGFSMNRQDDGRLQLEQARAYYKSRKCITWTRSKLLLLLANTIVSFFFFSSCLFLLGFVIRLNFTISTRYLIRGSLLSCRS
jgi:hypothetical protein